MISPYERMQELAGAGVPFAVATVVRTQGSTPQVVGAKLILTGRAAERPFGTLGGGCVEADAIDAATGVLAGQPASLREYQLTEELAWDTGLVCGGTMWILAERGAGGAWPAPDRRHRSVRRGGGRGGRRTTRGVRLDLPATGPDAALRGAGAGPGRRPPARHARLAVVERARARRGDRADAARHGAPRRARRRRTSCSSSR